MLYITGTRELSQIKNTGYSSKTILAAILFRHSKLYRGEFNIPKIKQVDGHYYLTEKQLAHIITFLDTYKKDKIYQFYISIIKKKNIKCIQKMWEKKLWN